MTMLLGNDQPFFKGQKETPGFYSESHFLGENLFGECGNERDSLIKDHTLIPSMELGPQLGALSHLLFSWLGGFPY